MRARPTLWALSVLFGLLVGTLAAQTGHGRACALVAIVGLTAVELSAAQRRLAELRVRTALRLADIGIREAAEIMGIDARDFERGLKGERKLDLWRLEMLPDRYHQEYWVVLAEEKGLPALSRTVLKMLWAPVAHDRSADVA